MPQKSPMYGRSAGGVVLAHEVSSWWSQMMAVEYERARGLRVPHETTSGFTV